MNNLLNVKRFGLVLNKDLQENRKKYALQFLTMFGIMAVILTLFSLNGYDSILNYADVELLRVASFLFFGFGVFFASTLMQPMREKTDRIAYLTLPASNFEKLFSRWLIVTVGYIIAFFVALWMADVVRVAFTQHNYPEIDIQFLNFSKLICPDKEDLRSSGYIYINEYVFFNKYFFGFCVSIYFLLQSLFILGATFWHKVTFAKTFSALVALMSLFIIINCGMIKIVHRNVERFGDKLNPVLLQHNMDKLSQNDFYIILIFILFLITFFSWVMAFFRFRESEIIKRL